MRKDSSIEETNTKNKLRFRWDRKCNEQKIKLEKTISFMKQQNRILCTKRRSENKKNSCILKIKIEKNLKINRMCRRQK